MGVFKSICAARQKYLREAASLGLLYSNHLHIMHTASVHQMFAYSNGVWNFPPYSMCCKGTKLRSIPSQKMNFSCLARVLNTFGVFLKKKEELCELGELIDESPCPGPGWGARVRPAPAAFQARCCRVVGTGLCAPSAAALTLTVRNLLHGACWGVRGCEKRVHPRELERSGSPSAVVGVVSKATRAPRSCEDG